MLRWGLALIVLAGLALGLALGVLNAEPVTLDLGLMRWTASLGAVVAATGGLGLLVGLLLGALIMGSGRSRRSSTAASRELNPSSTPND